MSLEELAFLALALVAVVTGLAALLVRELVHTIIWVAVFFVDLAAIYFLLAAPFLGVLQLGVYAGAVTILLLFGIMVTRKRIFSRDAATGIGPIPLALAAVTFIFLVTRPRRVSPERGHRDLGYDPAVLSAEPLRNRRCLAPAPGPHHALRASPGRSTWSGRGANDLAPRVLGSSLLSGALLAIGIFGILTRRNFILILIAIEIAMNATILNFVYFAAFSSGGAGLSGPGDRGRPGRVCGDGGGGRARHRARHQPHQGDDQRRPGHGAPRVGGDRDVDLHHAGHLGLPGPAALGRRVRDRGTGGHPSPEARVGRMGRGRDRRASRWSSAS